jgi:transcription termination/antitermination protein NusG
MNKQWFALFIRTRWESSTESVLRNKGFETFLPTYNAKSLRNGRLKDSFRVLFPGYVFCRFDIHNRLPILVTPGVISVVGRGRTPVPLEDGEITAIQTIASSGLPVEPWPYLEIGEKVRIQNHALAGLEGILLRFRGSDRVVVSVPLLRRAVAVEIDRSEVSSTRSERFVSSGLFPTPALAGIDTV